MKKIVSILIAICMTFTFNINAFAKNGTASLQKKMSAKEKIAGTAKLIAQYKVKFIDLMDQIESKNTELYEFVDQAENLTEEDRELLLDLLENDADYSWTSISTTYKKMMANAQKSELKVLTKLFETKYEEFNAVLDNLKEFENELPQYYVEDEDSQMYDGEGEGEQDYYDDNGEYDDSGQEYINNDDGEYDENGNKIDSDMQFETDASDN